ncbi:MAG: hypothetical protein WCI03_14260 [bacterium]
MNTLVLNSPLFADWAEQYVRLYLAGVKPGTAMGLTVNGRPAEFQYTGAVTRNGAEILVKLGFAKGEKKELMTVGGGQWAVGSAQNQKRIEISMREGVAVGVPGREVRIPALFTVNCPLPTLPPAIPGPFAGFAGRAMTSEIRCEAAFEGASLAQTNDGALFTDYELQYRFAENRRYTLNFRCYKHDSYIEVCETFSLGMNAELVWTLNPAKQFTHIISRDSFEGDSQPTVEPLGAEHPRDVLCRLQMPVLTEYFIPNNRGWFCFFDERNESRGMVGILGLYGAKWEEPVTNMPELLDKGGTVEWHSSLASGKRYWLLYAGAVEKGYQQAVGSGQWAAGSGPTPHSGLRTSADGRFVFHRLHAEFNSLRLDEHLDLAGEGNFDDSCATAPGVFAVGDYHAAARQRLQEYPCLGQVLPSPEAWMQANGSMHLSSYRYLLEPTPENAQALYGHLIGRFERWVRQFQGYRTGENDYMKNVIGFSRYLRGMLLGYEQLRRDGVLSDEQVRQLNAYFSFAARRILDEGRWPHSRTMLHPDHPESSRDFYTYGGEHKPDRLAWTNSLPNFQGDPMCALAHLSAVFKDHPDANMWRRFALDDIDRQLDAYCGKSGAWEESINYALYTFSYLIITFKAVKERWGLDYFNDERVRRFVGWLCHFFGPYDKRFDAYTWPGIGNAVVPQNQAEYLLCYAAELKDDDPLKKDCLAIWQLCAEKCRPGEHYPVVMAAMAPLHASRFTSHISPFTSEVMDEVGVALRDRHTQPDESYLFQKIGFAKDHYEADETAFNWYAKGTPLCMDYGTYTGDVGVGGAHNVVEIPDEDGLRRGYLADHLFTPALDYTRCEVPVTLKLLWGKVRSFAEVENKDGKIDRTKTPYFYIGDKNPVGPKTWKVRQLLFVKPDYTVLFDRVYGRIPHRYNLHFTGTDIRREGQCITAKGRFDLDLLAYVQHPAEFEMETGELIPNHPDKRHSQHYFRLYNKADGIYRTILFARERGRDVHIESCGCSGMKVVTPDYTDYVWLHNDVVDERWTPTSPAASDGGKDSAIHFIGRAGWIRRTKDGRIQVCLADGELIQAFGLRFEGRGPWSYDGEGVGRVQLNGGAPRVVQISKVKISCTPSHEALIPNVPSENVLKPSE